MVMGSGLGTPLGVGTSGAGAHTDAVAKSTLLNQGGEAEILLRPKLAGMGFLHLECPPIDQALN